MKIGIVGASSGGLFLACLLTKQSKNFEITIFDQKDKIGKKLCATGNGRCNLGNYGNLEDKYSNYQRIADILSSFSISEIRNFLSSIGIETEVEDGYVYPYSKSSVSFVEDLTSFLMKNHTKFILNTKVTDYVSIDNHVDVFAGDNKYNFDKVIFSTGGISSKKFGSDGNVFSLLLSKGYKLNEFKAGLTPILVKEDTSIGQGQRVNCNVTVLHKNNYVYSESGEVLFKKNGLSGIVIMNIKSIIERNNLNEDVTIVLDLLPRIGDSEIKIAFQNAKASLGNPLLSYFSKKTADLILNLAKPQDFLKFSYEKMFKFVKNLSFSYVPDSNFDESQISIGGLDLNNVSLSTLESISEKNVYFVGEMLDADGLCGGYNLMWCFASANAVVKGIKNGI